MANDDHIKLTEKEDRYLAALTNVLQVTFDQLDLVKYLKNNNQGFEILTDKNIPFDDREYVAIIVNINF